MNNESIITLISLSPNSPADHIQRSTLLLLGTLVKPSSCVARFSKWIVLKPRGLPT